MTTFIIRRVLTMIVSFFLISIVVFVTIQLPPGDYASNLIALAAGTDARVINAQAAQELANNIRARFGLDRPQWQQYLFWIGNFMRGDFGLSLETFLPVRELLEDRLLISFGLSLVTLLFTWAIGIPIGIYTATHKNSLGDHAATFAGFIGLSIPNFFLALVLMVFALYALDLPVGRLLSIEYEDAPWSLGKLWDLVRNLWIPVIVIGTAGTASTIRIMRGNLLEVLQQPHVTTARSKGMAEPVVIRRHSVRIAFNPFISALGLSLPAMLSGETITSIVLNLPTAGPLLFRALLQEDVYLAGSILQFFGIFLLLGNLLADIALAWLDPRIRYD